jgi:hypothetical protein
VPKLPRLLFLVVLALSVSAVGCPCVNSVVNADAGLRWWLFANFGASKVCPELLKRGVPIEIAPLGPDSVGRFFPKTCRVKVDDHARTMAVDVAGAGYVMLPIARRVGFSAALGVEYRPDFRLGDDATYVWGAFNRVTTPPDIRILGVENQIVNLATQTPLGAVGTVIAQAMVTSQVALGFTVVHEDDGDDFALGHLDPPARPPRPFQPGKDHVMLATDVTDLHSASRDYLGPFAVDSKGAALWVHLRVAGAPVDYVVVDKATGDQWLVPYEAGQLLAAAPAPPIAYGMAPIGDTQRVVNLNPGLYYVVVENLAPAPPLGIAMPFETVATVTYGVEVGDRQ